MQGEGICCSAWRGRGQDSYPIRVFKKFLAAAPAAQCEGGKQPCHPLDLPLLKAIIIVHHVQGLWATYHSLVVSRSFFSAGVVWQYFTTSRCFGMN